MKALALSEVEEQLKLALNQFLTRPQAAMQALLDHSHDSYAKDLETAAKQLEQSASSSNAVYQRTIQVGT